MAVDIYLTSFFRKEFTAKTINFIHERTDPGLFQIHVYDNGSDKETRDFLYRLLEEKKIISLVLDSRNTGCLYNKLVFHAMTESNHPYYVVSDNDVYPPKLNPCWLIRMVQIMEKYPEIGMLTPQLPPQSLQMPYSHNDDVIFCKAVGNTLKLVRRSAFPVSTVKQEIGRYGDDGYISELMQKNGIKSAFCRDVYCYHSGQCEDWGYKKEDIEKDPRKVNGYGKFFEYSLSNNETYEPESKWKIQIL